MDPNVSVVHPSAYAIGPRKATMSARNRLLYAIRMVNRIDRRIVNAMSRLGTPIMRLAIGIVFVWFGALKVIGVSPAADLVATTVFFFPPELFVPVLGVWEVLIGLSFLYRPLVRLGILLLFVQLPGTFLPIVVLPGVVFTAIPYGLSVEGQYIIKNLVIIGAALVIGGTVRSEEYARGDTETRSPSREV